MNFAKYANEPLYSFVKDQVIERIRGGYWKPGDLLPSESKLAQEFQVSSGTVRKALNDLTSENFLYRRQGKGTFVNTHSTQRSLYHFFKLVTADGHRVPAGSPVLTIQTRLATARETKLLHLAAKTKIIQIDRVRELGGQVCIYEQICLPHALFKGLEDWPQESLRNDLYPFYQETYGITIHEAHEELRAISAPQDVAEHLNLDAGTPLLEINRVAHNLEAEPVELRRSLCISEHCHYVSTLR